MESITAVGMRRRAMKIPRIIVLLGVALSISDSFVKLGRLGDTHGSLTADATEPAWNG